MTSLHHIVVNGITQTGQSPQRRAGAGLTAPSKLGLATASCLLVSACVEVPPTYYGLHRNSYGARSILRDDEGIRNVSLCDSSLASSQSEANKKFGNWLMSPLAGLRKPDQTLLTEDLAGKFSAPTDLTYGPLVAILERDETSIVFWDVADMTPISEMQDAANTYCGRLGKAAFYLGSARKCGDSVPMPVSINGKSSTTPTFAIAEFACRSPGQR